MKKENDPYLSMGEKYQSCATRPRYLSFSWEREGILMSPNFTQKLSKSVLSALPPARKTFWFRHCVDNARQN